MTATATLKEKVIEAIQQLPADATMDEMMERMYFLTKVERGFQQIDSGEWVSHEEARARGKVLTPLRAEDDPIVGLGSDPVDCGDADASGSLDRHVYGKLD
jgi:predicted transcriptional regulator